MNVKNFLVDVIRLCDHLQCVNVRTVLQELERGDIVMEAERIQREAVRLKRAEKEGR